jgi:hypothetical protein
MEEAHLRGQNRRRRKAGARREENVNITAWLHDLGRDCPLQFQKFFSMRKCKFQSVISLLDSTFRE